MSVESDNAKSSGWKPRGPGLIEKSEAVQHARVFSGGMSSWQTMSSGLRSYKPIVAYVYHAALITILKWFMFRSITLVAVPY